MGYRVYYAKTYKVSYGGGAFNWQPDEFNEMVNNELQESWADDEFGTAITYEINPRELQAYIKKLRKNEGATSEYFKDYTKKDEADSFTEILNNADQENGYIVLKWF